MDLIAWRLLRVEIVVDQSTFTRKSLLSSFLKRKRKEEKKKTLSLTHAFAKCSQFMITLQTNSEKSLKRKKGFTVAMN